MCCYTILKSECLRSEAEENVVPTGTDLEKVGNLRLVGTGLELADLKSVCTIGESGES